MKTTVYTCDMCNKSVGEKELSSMTIKTSGLIIKNDKRTYDPTLKIDICKDCLKGKGFIVEQREDKTEDEIRKYNTKTLEDKILDILGDLNVAFCE